MLPPAASRRSLQLRLTFTAQQHALSDRPDGSAAAHFAQWDTKNARQIFHVEHMPRAKIYHGITAFDLAKRLPFVLESPPDLPDQGWGTSYLVPTLGLLLLPWASFAAAPFPFVLIKSSSARPVVRLVWARLFCPTRPPQFLTRIWFSFCASFKTRSPFVSSSEFSHIAVAVLALATRPARRRPVAGQTFVDLLISEDRPGAVAENTKHIPPGPTPGIRGALRNRQCFSFHRRETRPCNHGYRRQPSCDRRGRHFCF